MLGVRLVCASMSESDLSVMDGVMDTDSFLQEDLDLSSFNSMPIAPSVVGSVAPKKATKRDTVSNEGTDADILEVGFKVDVLASKANDDLLSNRKEWHSGTGVIGPSSNQHDRLWMIALKLQPHRLSCAS